MAAVVLVAAAAVGGLQPDLGVTPPVVLAANELAPELAGIEAWLNSPPLRVADLRGQVVIVDFWTYACGNCVHTLPDLRRWHERYAGQGLVIIGVHTPEFAFERELDNVRAATARLGVPYAVAIDNGYQTWRAYQNRYWPALYLIDREGRVVLTHFGDEGYPEIEGEIQKLLAP